jgi:hypothetical protein
MDAQPEVIADLRRQLGADAPPGVGALAEADQRDLALAIRDARHRQNEALAAAGERALDKVPRLLRGPIRKVVG